MVDRAKITENVQFGDETTEGTAVAADKNIRSFSVETKIGGAAEFFRPEGRRFNTLSVLNQEWATLALTGKITYTEFIYAIEMMMGHPTASTTGTAVKTRVWTMDDTTALAPRAMTIEKGSAVRAQRIAGAILTDLSQSFSRKGGATFTGSGMGRLFTDAITRTASPANLSLVPVVGKELDLYIDSTAAGLGTTKLLRAFGLDIGMTGVMGPVWPIDSAQTSYDGHVDLPPTTTAKIVVEADATGMSYLSQYRADDLLFVRIKGTSSKFVEPTFPYLFTEDICVGIKSVTPDTDDDGITTVEYDCELVSDATWAKSLSLSITDDIVTL